MVDRRVVNSHGESTVLGVGHWRVFWTTGSTCHGEIFPSSEFGTKFQRKCTLIFGGSVINNSKNKSNFVEIFGFRKVEPMCSRVVLFA